MYLDLFLKILTFCGIQSIKKNLLFSKNICHVDLKKTKTSIPPSCSGNRRPQTKRTFYTLDESWSHGIIILRYTMISNQYVELVNSINIMSHRTHF